jgi:hypothetical protein
LDSNPKLDNIPKPDNTPKPESIVKVDKEVIEIKSDKPTSLRERFNNTFKFDNKIKPDVLNEDALKLRGLYKNNVISEDVTPFYKSPYFYIPVIATVTIVTTISLGYYYYTPISTYLVTHGWYKLYTDCTQYFYFGGNKPANPDPTPTPTDIVVEVDSKPASSSFNK